MSPPDIFQQVIADLSARKEQGISTYGKTLHIFDSRDALREAYEEALDLAVYLKQALMERDYLGLPTSD